MGIIKIKKINNKATKTCFSTQYSMTFSNQEDHSKDNLLEDNNQVSSAAFLMMILMNLLTIEDNNLKDNIIRKIQNRICMEVTIKMTMIMMNTKLNKMHMNNI